MEEALGEGIEIFCLIQDNIWVKAEGFRVERIHSVPHVHHDMSLKISSSELHS